MLSLNEARARRQKVGFKPSDIDKPAFLGMRKVEVPLEELIPFLDEREPGAQLDEIVRSKALQARAVYGFWPALSIGDDIVLYRAESLREEIARFPMLRQQDEREHTTSLADFIAPKQSGLTDYIGAFALTTGLGADERLARAFAAYLHARARKDFGYEQHLGDRDIKGGKYRGIRIAIGDPACPDPTDKRTLFTLLGARDVGMDLTEQLAMTPAASVCGLYFAHPKAHSFRVGALAKDQVEDYATRKGMNVREVERWLQSNLAYEPE